MAGVMLGFQRRHRANAGKVLGHLPAKDLPAPSGLPGGLMAGQQLAELVDASLEEDLRALKEVASHERRAVIKRDSLIPKYRDYVRRLTEAGRKHALIGYYLVWLMDAAEIEAGLALALWCVEHGQSLPEGFKSSPAYFFSDMLCSWAEAETAAGRTAQPYVDTWRAAVDAAPAAWNLPDTITARWRKIMGRQAELDGGLAGARDHYEAALALGAKCKTALADVTRRLEKASPETPTEEEDGPGADG